MRIQKTKLYTFEELSDTAKEKAREWWRSASDGDNYFAEFVIEDAGTIAEILGIELQTRTVKLMGGGTRQEPVICWSGFCSQGDGACFSGRYRYVKGMVKNLHAYIGDESKGDKELHRIAAELFDVQKRNLYRAVVDIEARDRSMSVACEDASEPELRKEDFEQVKSALEDFAQWIYRQLEAEYEYQNSDEQVDETIQANEYEFTEEGARA